MPPAGAKAQSISDSDMRKMAENLAQTDANGDSPLGRDGCDTNLQLDAQDTVGRAAQDISYGRQATAFNQIDADRNGLLTKQEMKKRAP